MNKEFTQEELNNILVLISRTNITGKEATAVAVLQQKIQGMLELEPLKGVENKPEVQNNDVKEA